MSGVPATREHGAACVCVRCTGFPAGHELSLRHGSYARLRLSEKAAATADELRELLVVYDESDEPALQAFAFVVEQLKASATSLEETTNRATRLRLSQDARGWALAALRFSEQFGMTPRARIALGLDVVRGQVGQLTVTRLAQLVAAEDADSEGGETGEGDGEGGA